MRRPSAAPLDARCYLFYGPDEAGSRDLAASVVRSLGRDVERVDLTCAQLRADPTLLIDEAMSNSLFGAARYIRIDGAGDECLSAVDALLASSAIGHTVILIAGTLRKDSRLLKRLAAEPGAYTRASYLPEAGDLIRTAIDAAARSGLKLDAENARRIVQSAGGDQAVLRREIEKLADYADASPEMPVAATEAMIDAIGADREEADVGRVVDALTSGDARALEDGLATLGDDGQEAIQLVRATLRRLMAMAAVRAEIDRGVATRTAVDRAGKAMFWRDRDSVARDIGRWPAARLAAAINQMSAVERELKSSRGAGATLLDHTAYRLASVNSSRS